MTGDEDDYESEPYGVGGGVGVSGKMSVVVFPTGSVCVLAWLPHCEGAAVPPVHSLPQRMRGSNFHFVRPRPRPPHSEIRLIFKVRSRTVLYGF